MGTGDADGRATRDRGATLVTSTIFVTVVLPPSSAEDIAVENPASEQIIGQVAAGDASAVLGDAADAPLVNVAVNETMTWTRSEY